MHATQASMATGKEIRDGKENASFFGISETMSVTAICIEL